MGTAAHREIFAHDGRAHCGLIALRLFSPLASADNDHVSVLRVGLTGGIASGKSTVAELFAARGVPVIDTDEIAREVVAPGEPAFKKVVLAFGSEILAPDGSLDRRRERAFL